MFGAGFFAPTYFNEYYWAEYVEVIYDVILYFMTRSRDDEDEERRIGGSYGRKSSWK